MDSSDEEQDYKFFRYSLFELQYLNYLGFFGGSPKIALCPVNKYDFEGPDSIMK